ncbi:hypothetical protein LPJGGPFB_04715 [Ensifer adhaerens]|uniref:DUF535 family protein n=1 Tax=Ensifer adhaerens TaxID=106592 RepID=UPI0031F3403D|nr:hypothetical protein [Ensifer adhaerens]
MLNRERGQKSALGKTSETTRFLGPVHPRTTVSLGWSCFGRLGPSTPREKRRLWLGILRSPVSTLRWLEKLHVISEQSLVETIPFDLVAKPARRFLLNRLRPAQRSRLLASHYDVLLDTLGPEDVRALLTDGGLILSTLVGRTGTRYELRLERSSRWLAKEGELSCRLLTVDGGITVATLSFTIGTIVEAGPVFLWVGGLQGCPKKYGKPFTIQVTRDLFGLRPKDLLIHALYQLKVSFAAKSIMAVSNVGHVSFDVRSGRRWMADYDQFWVELGGVARDRYTFELPSSRSRRSIEEVAPSKRSAWRLRQALIDEVRSDISNCTSSRLSSVKRSLSGSES